MDISYGVHVITAHDPYLPGTADRGRFIPNDELPTFEEESRSPGITGSRTMHPISGAKATGAASRTMNSSRLRCLCIEVGENAGCFCNAHGIN